jgi:DNA-binding NarL/FixJ family response regulator
LDRDEDVGESSNAEIADRLVLSVRTVETRPLPRVFKRGVTDRHEL